ncbi:MAG: ribonuclease III [Verrucomicrobiota bacterium]
MSSLEEKIGYHFSNAELLTEALTHPSLAYESKRPHFDNQRLEYLGDAVLQLIITDEVFRLFPKFNEGKLTKLRSRLVSRAALCQYSNVIGLGEFLLLGKGEESTGGRKRPSNVADAFESLIGAIYLDGGYIAARDFLLKNFAPVLKRIMEQPEEVNPKGKLQETLQAISPQSPVYKIVDQVGPEHEKNFVAEVFWNNTKLGRGAGSSKKEAEMAAAISAMRQKLWQSQ